MLSRTAVGGWPDAEADIEGVSPLVIVCEGVEVDDTVGVEVLVADADAVPEALAERESEGLMEPLGDAVVLGVMDVLGVAEELRLVVPDAVGDCVAACEGDRVPDDDCVGVSVAVDVDDAVAEADGVADAVADRVVVPEPVAEALGVADPLGVPAAERVPVPVAEGVPKGDGV